MLGGCGRTRASASFAAAFPFLLWELSLWLYHAYKMKAVSVHDCTPIPQPSTLARLLQ